MKIAPPVREWTTAKIDVCVIGAGPCKLFCMFPTWLLSRHLNIRGVEYSSSRVYAGKPRLRLEFMPMENSLPHASRGQRPAEH